MSEQTEKIQISQLDNEEVEIDLVELLYFFKTKLFSIILMAVLGALIAGLVTNYLMTPKYQAASKLYMVSASNDSVVDLTDLNIGTSLSEDYAELLHIRPIFEEVIEEENLPYIYEELLEMVAIAPIEETRILTITVTSEKPEEAQIIANDLADKAVTYLPKLMDTSAPNIAERAIYPEEPSSPNLIKNTLLGGVVGLVLILAILVVLYIMDDTLKSAEDVEKTFGIMPLTVVPEGDMETISDKAEKEIRKKKMRRRRRKRGRR